MQQQQLQLQQGVRWRFVLPLLLLSVLMNGLSALIDAKPAAHHRSSSSQAPAAQPVSFYSGGKSQFFNLFNE